MPNFYPILFKFCAYVNNMFMYNMHRDREFPMKSHDLAALFLGLLESPLYMLYAHLFLLCFCALLSFNEALKQFEPRYKKTGSLTM